MTLISVENGLLEGGAVGDFYCWRSGSGWDDNSVKGGHCIAFDEGSEFLEGSSADLTFADVSHCTKGFLVIGSKVMVHLLLQELESEKRCIFDGCVELSEGEFNLLVEMLEEKGRLCKNVRGQVGRNDG